MDETKPITLKLTSHQREILIEALELYNEGPDHRHTAWYEPCNQILEQMETL